jgi:hypothetical protein
MEGGPVRCSRCGVANRAGAKFCTGCGQALEVRTCPHCGGQVLESVARFCPHCGGRLEIPAAPVTPPGAPSDVKTGHSLLPEPRSYASTAIMLGAPSALFFSIGMSLMLAATYHLDFGKVLPYGFVAGLFFGLFGGLTMAFFLKGETATIEVRDVKDFIPRLNVAMSQLGYFLATQTENFFTFKPSFWAGLAAGPIAVQLREGQAVVVGPKMYVKKLIKRLATS